MITHFEILFCTLCVSFWVSFWKQFLPDKTCVSLIQPLSISLFSWSLISVWAYTAYSMCRHYIGIFLCVWPYPEPWYRQTATEIAGLMKQTAWDSCVSLQASLWISMWKYCNVIEKWVLFTLRLLSALFMSIEISDLLFDDILTSPLSALSTEVGVEMSCRWLHDLSRT